MKKTITTFVIVLLLSLCHAQYICTQDEMFNYSPRDYHACNRFYPSDNQDTSLMIRSFVPNDSTPIVTIYVNMHIWREDDGTGSYWLDNQAYRDSLRKAFDFLNMIYSHNNYYSENIPNAPFIEDTRVRFEIDTFFYYNNSYMAHQKHFIPFTNYLLNNFPERLNRFNYHLSLDTTAYYSGISSGYNSQYHSIVSVKQNKTECYLYAFAMHMAHEFGHNFGLGHTYNSEVITISDPEFLWDVFGTATQPWCNAPSTNVCYHQDGWDCEVSDPTNTCTNNIMGGTKYSRHFSALQMGRIQRALTVSTLKNYAYGYGKYPYCVRNNQIIDYNRKCYQDIVVDSGSTLTITCCVSFVPQARIIVRPGGKLIVDGGTLTSACAGEMWQGIYVEGHRTQHQTAANQGTVQLLNGATIENARRGIYTGAYGENWHTTGGIITADSATFRNCAKAVEYLSYADTTYPGYIADNKGSFTNCTFTVDDNNLFAADNTDFLAHVTMWDVKGVSFTRCRFEDVRTQGHTRKSAISTIDAGFKIKNGCDYTLPLSNPDCNCYLTTNTYCSFSGFGTAINAATSGNPYVVSIDGARFSNNMAGVKIEGNTHVEVTRCIFDLSNSDVRVVTGLTLDSCTGYLVEENVFTRSANAPAGTRYGIMVRNSGTDANSLYRNTFERMSQGIYVAGINGNTSSGLQMTCNSFSDNNYDMYLSTNALVCPWQGNNQKGADNTFSGTQSRSLNNAGSQLLTYIYSPGSNHVPYNPTTSNVLLSGTATVNTCGSTICGYNPDIPIPPPGPKSPTPGFLALKQQYENLQADFDRNGYAHLLATSIPPQAEPPATSDELVAAQYAAQQINAIATELYAQSHAAVRALMADTLEDVQAVHAWLDATPGLTSRYLAVETGFAQESEIANYLTTASERDEYDNYVAFQALKDALSYGNGHVAWPNATDAQVWELVRIADANTGRSSLLAKNVLCFFFEICYDDDEETRVLAATNTIPPMAEPPALTGKQNIIVHPNPTDNVLHVSVTDGEIARVEMFDAYGRNVSVETQNFASLPSPKTTVNTSALPSGVYILRVTLRDGAVRTVKVVKR